MSKVGVICLTMSIIVWVRLVFRHISHVRQYLLVGTLDECSD